jgi:hypothetical protein
MDDQLREADVMDGLLFALTLIAALGAGLVAGMFFAFSAFIMGALGRLPAEGGIAAMQSINVAVLNPVFFTAFFGTAAIALVLAIAALFVTTRCSLSARGQPALSHRDHLRDYRRQRAAQQQARFRQTSQHRGRERVEALPFVLDRLEHGTHSSLVSRRRVLHHGPALRRNRHALC